MGLEGGDYAPFVFFPELIAEYFTPGLIDGSARMFMLETLVFREQDAIRYSQVHDAPRSWQLFSWQGAWAD